MIERTSVRWRHLDDQIEYRLLMVINSWMGTGYMAGQQAKKMGVDCVQFVGGILDELYRQPKTHIPRLPQNAGIHSEGAGTATILALRKGIPSIEVADNWIEPGDVIVTRGTMNMRAHPFAGHTLLAGCLKGTAVHAVPSAGVSWTSIDGVPGILRVYRPLNKELWV